MFFNFGFNKVIRNFNVVYIIGMSYTIE